MRFTGHPITTGQVTQVYIPPPIWADPPYFTTQYNWGYAQLSFGKYGAMWRCLPPPYHPILIPAHPKHPYIQTLLAAVPHPDPTSPRASADIRGEVASALSPPPGCRFHPRCPSCLAICDQQAPRVTAITPTHTVACHLHDQMAVGRS